MYLAILDSMIQFLLHVGHGLGNINPREFNIYLNFEASYIYYKIHYGHLPIL